MTFRDMIKESPVGMVGRTKEIEALEHIEKTDLAKKFRKIVQELGGKTVARNLLAMMDQEGKKVKVHENQTMNPIKYLRNSGYKIKDEVYETGSFEIEFFKSKDAKNAYEDLVDAGFLEYYGMTLVGKFIEFTDL